MRIKQTTTDVGFRPIEVTLVIETEEEYEALRVAAGYLDDFDICESHPLEVRKMWVFILESIAKECTRCRK